MKLQKLARQLTQLIERELKSQLSAEEGKELNHFIHTSQSFIELFRAWKITMGKPVIRFETEMMGAGNTIYVKLGHVVFAVIQNYDANPDGLNRFILVVPVYAEPEKGNLTIFGHDEAPMSLIADAFEKLTDILVELHNRTL
ncbi:hypothetical protein D3C87_1205430 [compost metagenome]